MTRLRRPLPRWIWDIARVTAFGAFSCERPSYWESGPWTGPLDLLMYLTVDRLKSVGLSEEMDHAVDQRCPTMDHVVDLAMDLAIGPLRDLHADIQRYNHFLFWLPSQDASQ
jgi:hypothetical protein